MKISEAIDKVKKYHYGISRGAPIDEEKTRDKVLYGNPEQELTGIVTTVYASADVIRKAKELGANLIISHEGIFWNSGDHTDWLKDNPTFREKASLLDEGNIVVWRDHDYIHSGIPVDGTWMDGIFYGIMKVLGWEEHLIGMSRSQTAKFQIPTTTVRELGRELMNKLPLNGIQIVGSPDSSVSKVWFPGHLGAYGPKDIANISIAAMEEEDFDTLICFELVDNHVATYVKDSTQLGRNRTILHVGHFNMEEPGMEYMVEYLPAALGEDIPCTFIPSTDMYNFLTNDP